MHSETGRVEIVVDAATTVRAEERIGPMAYRTRWIVIAGVVMLFGSSFFANRDDRHVATARDEPEWLFTATATAPAEFDSTSSTLSFPTDAVLAFTDRPYRATQVITPKSFVDLWGSGGDDSFGADPPNAVLTYYETAQAYGPARTVVCEVLGAVVSDDASRPIEMGIRVLEPSGTVLPDRMYSASLFVDGLSPSCLTSQDDEAIVEYFNEVNFSDQISVLIDPVVAVAGSFDVTLSCPERLSPEYPPSDYELTMELVNSSTSTTCDSARPMRVTPASAPAACNSAGCEFEFIVSNSTTMKVFSTTVTRIRMASGEVAPELSPATLPICAESLGALDALQSLTPPTNFGPTTPLPLPTPLP